MSMSVSIPPELQPFIEQELACGPCKSEEELVARALLLYQEMKARHNELRSRAQRSLEQADLGHAAELDIEAVITRGYERMKNQGITD
jgi:Arc/MetJ-type ribon-helix-helix transcriptional regulator